MAISTPCTYRSVTLQPGETYVLPPGAELVGATDSTQLSSTNDCLNTDNLENFECYAVMFTKTLENGAGELPAYGDIYIYGIRIGETDYPFSSMLTLNTYLPTGPGGAGNTTAITLLRTAIDSTSLGGTITDLDIIQYIGTNSNENGWKVVFKTIPSIGGNHTRMSFYGIASGGRSGIGSFEIEFDVVPYDDRLTDDTSRPYPVCS